MYVKSGPDADHMPHTATPTRQLDNDRLLCVGAGTSQREKRKEGEQSAWSGFS